MTSPVDLDAARALSVFNFGTRIEIRKTGAALVAEVEALRETVASLRDERDGCGVELINAEENYEEAQAENAVLRGENQRLREALTFYADPETYDAIMFIADPPCGEFADDFSEDHGDPYYNRAMPGKHAREALGGET